MERKEGRESEAAISAPDVADCDCLIVLGAVAATPDVGAIAGEDAGIDRLASVSAANV